MDHWPNFLSGSDVLLLLLLLPLPPTSMLKCHLFWMVWTLSLLHWCQSSLSQGQERCGVTYILEHVSYAAVHLWGEEVCHGVDIPDQADWLRSEPRNRIFHNFDWCKIWLSIPPSAYLSAESQSSNPGSFDRTPRHQPQCILHLIPKCLHLLHVKIVFLDFTPSSTLFLFDLGEDNFIILDSFQVSNSLIFPLLIVWYNKRQCDMSSLPSMVCIVMQWGRQIEIQHAGNVDEINPTSDSICILCLDPSIVFCCAVWIVWIPVYHWISSVSSKHQSMVLRHPLGTPQCSCQHCIGSRWLLRSISSCLILELQKTYDLPVTKVFLHHLNGRVPHKHHFCLLR